MASTDPNAPRTSSTGGSWLFAAACLLYIPMMFLIVISEPDIGGCGDPASCGITEGIGAVVVMLGGFFTVLLWIVLAILLFAGGTNGDMPPWAMIVAVVLLLLSGVAAICAGVLYSRYAGWTIAVPALLPPLIMLYAMLARLPAVLAALPVKIAKPAALGAILILTIAPVPLSAIDASRYAARGHQLQMEREALVVRRHQEEAQGRERTIARFEALNPDSLLGDYLDDLHFPHPYAAGEAHHQEALTKARQVKSRQTDAALLLHQVKIERLQELWNLDIEATPAICRAYGDALRQEVAKMDLGLTNDQEAVERQLPNIRWLVGAHCDLDAALGLVETRFREWCGRHQCRTSDIADRPILTFLDTVAALRQPH